MAAVGSCQAEVSCKAFCITGPKTYTQLNLIAAAHNDDPNEVDKLDCFTKRSRFNILTAQSNIDVTFATQPNFAFGMEPENMIDGVDDMTVTSCHWSELAYNPYVVFDIGEPRNISNVSLIGPPESHTLIRFQELDIRVGNTLPTGDFSSYRQLGYMSGMAPYASYEYNTNAVVPITGRYISVQSMKYVPLLIQICHVEIYV